MNIDSNVSGNDLNAAGQAIDGSGDATPATEVPMPNAPKSNVPDYGDMPKQAPVINDGNKVESVNAPADTKDDPIAGK